MHGYWRGWKNCGANFSCVLWWECKVICCSNATWVVFSNVFFSKCWLCTWLLTVFLWLSCLFTFLNIAQILYINRQSCFLTFYLSRLQAAADCLMLALTTMSTCLLCFVLFRKLLVEWVWTPRRPRRCGKTKRLLKSTLPCFTVIRYNITTCWRKTQRSPNYSQIVWKIKAQICWVNTKNKSLYQTENRKWMKHFTEILCLLFAYFQKAGVTISDHHSASESFMKHMENEVNILSFQPPEAMFVVLTSLLSHRDYELIKITDEMSPLMRCLLAKRCSPWLLDCGDIFYQSNIFDLNNFVWSKRLQIAWKTIYPGNFSMTKCRSCSNGMASFAFHIVVHHVLSVLSVPVDCGNIFSFSCFVSSVFVEDARLTGFGSTLPFPAVQPPSSTR